MARKRKQAKRSLIALFVILLIITLLAILFIKNIFRKNSYKDPIYPHYENRVDERPRTTTIVKIGTKKINTIDLPILMYHYVEYVKDPGDTIRKSLNINPALFEDQLKSMEDNGLTTYFVRDIPDIFSGKIKGGGKNKIILTFDDGYEDFYTDAFPILKKHKAKATVYIVYNFIGNKGFLNEKEIRELVASGLVEIGSHTLDHSYLKTANQVVAREQIIDSKALLEKMFDIKVDTFAYPYGAYNQSNVRLVYEAGYKAAVTVVKGTKQSDNNIFGLYRLRAGGYH